MSDVFISYARSTARQAQAITEALRALGYSVWRDDDLPSHRTYSDVIEEQLASAKSVLVIWSGEAVKSHWVRSEADRARAAERFFRGESARNTPGAGLGLALVQAVAQLHGGSLRLAVESSVCARSAQERSHERSQKCWTPHPRAASRLCMHPRMLSPPGGPCAL